MLWIRKLFGWGSPKPYLEFLPEPNDASVNALRDLIGHLESGELNGGEIESTLNYIESPSTQLAIKLQFDAYDSSAKFKLNFDVVPEPDPRESTAQFPLWKYNFKTASPAVPRPSCSSVSAVAELAGHPYDYLQNWNQAATMAAGFQPESIRDILAVMVHPPQVFRGVPAWVWLPRVQLAAAQLVAQIEMAHGFSISNSFLADVTMGPIDWTIDAAVIALVQRARSEPEICEDVRSLFAALAHRIPWEGYWSCMETTFRNWLLLPSIPSEEQTQIEEILADF